MKKLFSTRCSDNSFSFAILVLRLGVGSLMAVSHGYTKLKQFSTMAAGFSDPFHVGSMPSLAMVIFAEFFCSIFIILGLFTRLACIPLIINMAIALFYAHHGDLFHQGEMAALYLISFITLLFTGAGKVSLDRFIGR